MPKASAPKAPWVEVCESPQTMVVPGKRPTLLRSDDMDDALADIAHRQDIRRRIRARCFSSVATWVADSGSAMPLARSVVGTL